MRHRSLRKDRSTPVVLRLRLSSISSVMSVAKHYLHVSLPSQCLFSGRLKLGWPSSWSLWLKLWGRAASSSAPAPRVCHTRGMPGAAMWVPPGYWRWITLTARQQRRRVRSFSRCRFAKPLLRCADKWQADSSPIGCIRDLHKAQSDTSELTPDIIKLARHY